VESSLVYIHFPGGGKWPIAHACNAGAHVRQSVEKEILLSHSLRGSTCRQAEAYRIVSDALVIGFLHQLINFCLPLIDCERQTDSTRPTGYNIKPSVCPQSVIRARTHTHVHAPSWPGRRGIA